LKGASTSFPVERVSAAECVPCLELGLVCAEVLAPPPPLLALRTDLPDTGGFDFVLFVPVRCSVFRLLGLLLLSFAEAWPVILPLRVSITAEKAAKHRTHPPQVYQDLRRPRPCP
jgi:hypothetical protein